MRIRKTNSWNVTPQEAVRIQHELRSHVILEDDIPQIKIVAGVDVGFSPVEGTAVGGVVALTYPEMELIEMATASVPVEFPYIPGLLAFRELPAILAAFELLSADPDLLVVDGQGLAHPRRFGIACHLGILLDRPSVGCGKSRLVGEYEEPGREAGSSTLLHVRDERLGSVVRTKTNVKPIFVSPGHRVSFDTAVRLVLDCVKGYRLPEPTRLADKLVSRTMPESCATMIC